MPYHRFKVDQTVVPSTPSLPTGRYTIVRLLPLVSGEPRYRVRGTGDALERAVLQSEIKLPDPDDSRPARQRSEAPAAAETNGHSVQEGLW
jgi:hypothetical protein